MPSQVDLELDDGEDDNQIWSHINGSPFTVPVSLPLSYILNVVEISEKNQYRMLDSVYGEEQAETARTS